VTQVRSILTDALIRLRPLAPREPAKDTADHLELYVQEIHAYNAKHRVVGPASPEQIAGELVVDALGLWPFVTSPLADVGSGAGLPGIVLKLVDPQIRVTLIEPRQKPAAFLSWMVGTLRLAAVKVVDRRAEELRPSDLLDGLAARCVVAKGFGPLEKLTAAAGHLAAPDGILLVPSSSAAAALPAARSRPHPLIAGRFVHSVSRSSLAR
jgi:16S rRNA (guanine527-N7)-methyltransferase